MIFGAAGLLLGASVVVEFMETRFVPRLPTAVLATGLMLLAFLSLGCGLIVDSIARGRREAKRVAYLAAGALREPRESASHGSWLFAPASFRPAGTWIDGARH